VTKELLSRADVAKIAALARIPLTGGAVEQARRDLTGVLAHFAQIQQVATEKVATSDDVTGLKNVTRADNVNQDELCSVETLLSAAPARSDNHIKVKAVFE
jgi:aspartyl-tRNA(Asn)/glutamyl-tRNA(Gln) amidotransferase subunit C